MLAMTDPEIVNNNLESMDKALDINLRGLIHCDIFITIYFSKSR